MGNLAIRDFETIFSKNEAGIQLALIIIQSFDNIFSNIAVIYKIFVNIQFENFLLYGRYKDVLHMHRVSGDKMKQKIKYSHDQRWKYKIGKTVRGGI